MYGGSFPNFKGSLWEKESLPQRNATTTTIAPTGTLSIIANTSSGIEPIFDVRYSRLLLGDIEVEVEDPLWQEMKGQPDAGGKLAKLFRTAYQVAPLDHLRIQESFQNHVDNAVSKTINLPEDGHSRRYPHDIRGGPSDGTQGHNRLQEQEPRLPDTLLRDASDLLRACKAFLHSGDTDGDREGRDEGNHATSSYG